MKQHSRKNRRNSLSMLCLMVLLLLAACDREEQRMAGVELTVEPERSAEQGGAPDLDPSPTRNQPQADVAPSSTPEGETTRPAIESGGATPPGTSPIPAAESVTPTATKSGSEDVPATPEIVAPESSQPVQPAVSSFEAIPARANAGDTVTLNWNAAGSSATICPSARYVLFTAADCQSVPLIGTMAFTIPEEAASFPSVDFLLTVQSDPFSPVVQQQSVAINCALTWFFSNEPQAGICPTEPVNTFAAAQRFERGTMIWLQNLGRYIILDEVQAVPGGERKQVYYVHDPLELTGDSSGDVTPPEGMFAPSSGFGFVWRGDASNSPGFRDILGWAIAPESGYDAVFQCDNAPPSGGRSWQTCYLRGPGGELIVFHPLGGWNLSPGLPSTGSEDSG